MTRPIKNTVNYFPHYCHHKQTMYVIEQKYPDKGYAAWFKLLELLGDSDNHYYDCNKEESWLFLQAKTKLLHVELQEFLQLLSKLEAIDSELWQQKIIWSQNFVNGLAPLYVNRRRDLPKRPIINNTINSSIDTCNNGNHSDITTCINAISTGNKHESNVKKSNVKKSN